MDEKDVTGSIHELKAQMKFIVETLTKLDNKFDRIHVDFVTKDIHNLEIAGLKKQIDTLQSDFESYKVEQREDKQTNKQVFPSWIGNLIQLGTIVVAIIAIFVSIKGG